MKNTTSFALLTVQSALCILSATAEPAVEPQVVQIPDEPPPPLTNLVWKLPPKFATLGAQRHTLGNDERQVGTPKKRTRKPRSFALVQRNLPCLGA